MVSDSLHGTGELRASAGRGRGAVGAGNLNMLCRPQESQAAVGWSSGRPREARLCTVITSADRDRGAGGGR